MPTTPSVTVPIVKRKPRASFLDLFVGQSEIDKIKGELQLRQERKRTASANAAAAQAKDVPAVDPPAETPKPDESVKPGEDAKPAEDAAKAAWTQAEDFTLVSLKGQNKSWKEIGDVLVGREKDELRFRFKEIGGAAPGEGGEAAKEDGAAAKGAQSDQGKGNKGKQKGDGGKKGKGQQGDTKEAAKNDEPAKDAPSLGTAVATTSAGFVNPNEAVVADKTDRKIKGILKQGSDGAFQFENVKITEGAKTINGSPIIYIDENDPLDIEELSHLYNMNCAFEEQRWIRMASKFFDQTGKRIEPEWLREKLKNCV
ncbi:MAG: hypothetical protein Q9216_003363 [Gyalolechia sp. 2 TL-2023]